MIKVKLSKVDEDGSYKVLRHDAYTVNVISRDPLNEGKLRFKIGSKVYSYTIEEFLTHVVKIYPLAIVPSMYEDIVQRNGGKSITRNTLLSPMVDYSKILPDFYYRKLDKHDNPASGAAYILLPESLTENFMRKVYDVAKLPLTDESLVSLHNIYNSIATSISNNASSNGKKEIAGIGNEIFSFMNTATHVGDIYAAGSFAYQHMVLMLVHDIVYADLLIKNKILTEDLRTLMRRLVRLLATPEFNTASNVSVVFQDALHILGLPAMLAHNALMNSYPKFTDNLSKIRYNDISKLGTIIEETSGTYIKNWSYRANGESTYLKSYEEDHVGSYQSILVTSQANNISGIVPALDFNNPPKTIISPDGEETIDFKPVLLNNGIDLRTNVYLKFMNKIKEYEDQIAELKNDDEKNVLYDNLKQLLADISVASHDYRTTHIVTEEEGEADELVALDNKVRDLLDIVINCKFYEPAGEQGGNPATQLKYETMKIRSNFMAPFKAIKAAMSNLTKTNPTSAAANKISFEQIMDNTPARAIIRELKRALSIIFPTKEKAISAKIDKTAKVLMVESADITYENVRVSDTYLGENHEMFGEDGVIRIYTDFLDKLRAFSENEDMFELYDVTDLYEVEGMSYYYDEKSGALIQKADKDATNNTKTKPKKRKFSPILLMKRTLLNMMTNLAKKEIQKADTMELANQLGTIFIKQYTEKMNATKNPEYKELIAEAINDVKHALESKQENEKNRKK